MITKEFRMIVVKYTLDEFKLETHTTMQFH